MIKQVSHTTTRPDATDLTLALEAAHELHQPETRAPKTRAPEVAVPEVAVPEMMGLRTTAARPHRRKVPLARLTTMRG